MTRTTETPDGDAQPVDRATGADGPHGRPIPDGGQTESGSSSEVTDRDAAGGIFGPDVEQKLKAGAAVVLGLLATWATFQVYLSSARIIEEWVSPEYEPFFNAGFNLIVVLVAVAGVVWLVRELS